MNTSISNTNNFKPFEVKTQNETVVTEKRPLNPKFLDQTTGYRQILPKSQVSISEEAMKKVSEEKLLNDTSKTSFTVEKGKEGRVIYKFTDKETGEIIKQFPSDDELANIDRIQKFLKGVTEALVKSDNFDYQSLMTDEELAKIVAA